MTLTKKRLAEIKTRAEAAEPGQWVVGDNSDNFTDILGMSHSSYDPSDTHITCTIAEAVRVKDAHFIANSRTDIPDLVAEVERLHGLLKRVEWADEVCGETVCPFCGTDKYRKYRYDSTRGRHFEDCPAFTPDGVVK